MTSSVVNPSKPVLTVRKHLTVSVSCPGCNESMSFDAQDVDIGNIVKCSACLNKTYYPFDKPWYRNTKLIFGYFISIVVSFVIGLGTNYIYDKYKNHNSVSHEDTLKKLGK